MAVPTTYDYSNRQVDLELLKSVVNPSQTFQRVYPSVVTAPVKNGADPKSVTGIEKAIQRYTNLLLTNIYYVKFQEEKGSDLVIRVFNGSVSSTAVLNYLFYKASYNAMLLMATDDTNEGFGNQPDDEKIKDATLLNSYIDYANATISLNIGITMVSGLNYTYVVPVKAGLS